MRKLLFPLFIFLISWAYSYGKKEPKLVVGIVVDQMRYDFLTRYWDKYGDHGFKKLIKEGFDCKGANYNYMPTYTGPGHASIYTGTTPQNHGIIANTWYNKFTNQYIYCAEDTLFKTVGSSSKNGEMSPRNMIGTTITDEIKLATNKKGKVFGISIKDRGAVLPAGHMADGAYWFEGGDVGKWITSSFYMDQLPPWLIELNEKNPSEKYLSKPWNTLYPINSYTESIADDNLYEELFIGETISTFPHDLPSLRDSNNNYSLVKSTPFGNTILKELALKLIQEENLGKDEFPDFLSISFSSPDYIGHQFGPMSVEIEDTYLRLDQDIADMLEFLERNFKKGEFMLFLTADHGVVNVPQYLIDNHIQGGYFDQHAFKDSLKDYVKSLFGTNDVIANVSNYQVFLDRLEIRQRKLNVDFVENVIVEFLLNWEGIAKAVTASALREGDLVDDLILGNTCRGFHQVRSGDILFILEPGWIPSKSRKGTTHGSPYHYDTHVPLIWYGGKVNRGTSTDYLVIPDIAASVAGILDIQPPSSCTGKIIPGLIKGLR